MFNLKRKITTQTFSVIEKKKKKKRKTGEERRKKKKKKKDGLAGGRAKIKHHAWMASGQS